MLSTPASCTRFVTVSSPAVGADADGRAVLRFGERFPRRDRALIAIVGVLRAPFAENARRAADHDRAIIERGILHQRAGKESLLEGCGINERKHRRAGWPASLESTVVFVMLEVAPTHQGENATGLVVERNDRALQIIRWRKRF